MSFRPDIEGLRAVAILFVVIYHAGWRWSGGGYLGVDVFFVISGFLITGILLDEVAATGTISLSNFWARRARRLLPAAAVVTVVVLVANRLLFTPFDQVEAAKTVRASAVYASNLLFAIGSTEYFGGNGDRDPMLHTWSLAVEEQFYLLLAPTLLALVASSIQRGHAAFLRRFGIATVGMVGLSFAGCLLLVQHYPLISFFILPSRIWELGLGALAAVVVRRGIAPSGPGAEAVSLAALAGLLCSAAFLGNGVVQPLGLATVIPTVSTAVLILTGAGVTPTLAARLLSTPPMRLIGRLSYAWYLWHWPMLVYVREVVDEPSLALRMGVVVLALLPAAAVDAWIATPIRFAKRLQPRPGLSIAGALALAVLTVGLASVAIVRAEATLATAAYQPLVAGRQLPVVYANGCHLSIAATDGPACRFGPGTTDTTVVLFGDSHAAQWFPALDSVARLRGWTLRSFTKSACPSVPIALTNRQLGRRYTECESWVVQSIARIQALRPAVVVIANTRAYEVIVDGRPLRTDRSDAARAAWQAGVRRLLAQLAPSGARVLVLQNNPHPQVEPSRCLAKHIGDAAACASFTTRPVDSVLAPVERAAVAGVSRASYLSLNEFLCDGAVCPIVRDGVVRYQDGNHVSVRYAASLAPEWSRALTQLFVEH